MAVNQPRHWLIAYDLRDQRRIARVHRLLTQVAVPVQYSVFAAVGSVLAMRRLAKDIEERIDVKVDDVRMYPLPAPPLLHTIGRAWLPEDTLLVDASGKWEAIAKPNGTSGRTDHGRRTVASTAEARRSSAAPAPSARHEMQNSAHLREPQP